MQPTLERRQRGFVLMTFAAISIVLVGFAGLVFDVGMMRYWKRRTQNAADSAAAAAIAEISAFGTNSDYLTAARNDAAAMGFVEGQNGVTITINTPPAAGQYIGSNKFVEAIVTRTVPLTFMSILRSQPVTVSARAVAAPQTTSACVIVLETSNDKAFEAKGTSQFTNKCGIAVNSTHGNALDIAAGACVTASSIDVVGGYTGKAYSSCNPKTGSMPVNTGSSPAADPFASVPAPSVGACNFVAFMANTTQTRNPGVYCDGLKIAGGTITMNPGLYILNGGGLSVNAGTVLIGTGVTFFNTAGGSYAYKPITLNGGATIQLKAPTSGTYEAILFFTDRAITNTTNNNIAGNSSYYIEGALYFPTVPIQFAGTSDLAAYTIMVVKSATITGNAIFNNDYSSLQSGSPIRGSGGGMLVE